MDTGRPARFMVAMLVIFLILECLPVGYASGSSTSRGTGRERCSSWCLGGKSRKLAIDCQRRFIFLEKGTASESLRVVPSPPPAPRHNLPPPP